MNTTHKIVKLEVSNFKNLKAVSITPDGNVITLTGPNGAGKSAILDAMQAVFAGKEGSVERPIRDGAPNSEVCIDLGNGLTAKRRYTPSGSTLKIAQTDPDAPRMTPQAMMDKLCNYIAFDPLAFTNMKAKDQRDLVLKLVGVDPAAIDRKAKEIFDARTITNREVERLTNVLCAMPPFNPTVPAEEVPTASLLTELAFAQADNIKRESAIAVAKGRIAELEMAKKGVAEAEKALADWQRVLEARRQAVAEAEQHVSNTTHAASLMKEIPIKPIQDKIADNDRVNSIIRDNKKRREHEAKLDEAVKQAEAATKTLAELEQQKQKLVREAKMPIEGLSFDDAGVLFNGKPLSLASTGHRIRVSAAIGMALNPQLRVLFVRDGSLLDSEGLKVLAEMAEKNGFQIWVEDARSTDPTAIVISDGEIAK